MPDSIEVDDIKIIEFLVKSVYYGNLKDIETTTLNEMRMNQFTPSSKNDITKIAPSSDDHYMHILRSAHTSGFEWVECLHNVTISDPALGGYIMKDGIFVPKWLSNQSTFNLVDFLRTCKSKIPKCTSCKCAIKCAIPCLPQCLCDRKCKRK